MRQLFKISALVLGLSILSFGCNKDKGKSASTVVITPKTVKEITEDPEAKWEGSITPSADVSILLSELAKPLNTKTVMAGASGILKIAFPDKLSVDIYLPLRKSDGTAVTGNVDVKEILLRTNGDFIRQNRPTQTASAMLVTGGSYYLNITQGGEALTAEYQFKLPQPDANYDLFQGRDAGNNENVWDEIKADSGRVQRWRDSVIGGDTFYNYCCTNKFDWINCDYFYNCGCPLTLIKVKLPKEFGNLNTKVMCVFKDINSVTSLYGNATSKLFESGTGYKAPIGKEVTIVVLCRKDGKYYFKAQDETLLADGTYDVTPDEVTLASMKTLIDNL